MNQRNKFGTHNVFTLGGLEFSSNFDSGNLKKVELVDSSDENYLKFNITSTGDFEIHELCDERNCGIIGAQTVCRTWFHFRVKGGKEGVHVKFRMFVGSIQLYLMNEHRPVIINNKTGVCEILPKGSLKANPLAIYKFDVHSLSINYTYKENDMDLSFALMEPYSYQKLEGYLSQKEKLTPEGVYFHKCVLAHSLEKRNVHLVTISSMKNIKKNKFENIKVMDETKPPNAFGRKKKIVLISSRVHPSESPASWILHGLIEFVTHPTDPRAQLLRDKCVFKIVPMVNPDGVFYGFTRFNTRGDNMNRHYENPTEENHPVNAKLRNFFKSLISGKQISLYLDLHAHANKSGCFCYGDDQPNFVENMLLAKLISLNSKHFDFSSCVFTEYKMEERESDHLGESMSGTGRCQFSKLASQEAGGICSFTIECNYTKSKKVNKIVAVDADEKTKELFSKQNNSSSGFRYDRQSCLGIGEGIALGILDRFASFKKNKYSRLRNSKWGDLKSLREDISRKLDSDTEKYVTTGEWRYKKQHLVGNKKPKTLNEVEKEEEEAEQNDKVTILC